MSGVQVFVALSWAVSLFLLAASEWPLSRMQWALLTAMVALAALQVFIAGA